MTLQRMNQGYEIVEFERLQTELIRELREISLPADAWFQKKISTLPVATLPSK